MCFTDPVEVCSRLSDRTCISCGSQNESTALVMTRSPWSVDRNLERAATVCTGVQTLSSASDIGRENSQTSKSAILKVMRGDIGSQWRVSRSICVMCSWRRMPVISRTCRTDRSRQMTPPATPQRRALQCSMWLAMNAWMTMSKMLAVLH